MSTPTPSRPYFSNGQVLQSSPLTVRIRRFFSNTYMTLGLYVVSLFSLDPFAAAESSIFNVRNSGGSRSQTKPRWGSGGGKGPWGGGGGGGGGGSGSGGSGGSKKFGTVDDVRGPECGSCG